MRLGVNPQKNNAAIELLSNHRIVMVIYIPELSGYYKSMLNVVKCSIESLIKTIPETSKITIVDNGSCQVVQDYLTSLFKSKKIDSIQLLSENIGKIDALIGAARASREPIITLTDCDIYFKPNWVYETIKIFNAFKKVSSVSPIPTKGFNYYTFSTREAILKGKLKLKREFIKDNIDDYNLFLKSINWDVEVHEKPWNVIKSNNVKAVVGSDHQVLTIRRDVLFNNSPKCPSLIKVGSLSEENYIDLAIDTSGGLRLSTYNFHALHLGNTLEPWMLDLNNKMLINKKGPILMLKPKLKYLENQKFGYKFKKKIIKWFF